MGRKPRAQITADIKEIKERERKKLRKQKIKEELKAFSILFFIVAGVSLVTFYWYNHYYDASKRYETKKESASEENEYEFLSLKTDEKFTSINGEFFLEKVENSIKRIINKEGKTIFNNEYEVNYAYPDLNSNLYIYLKEQGDYENKIEIYKVKEKEIKKIKTLVQVNMHYEEVFYRVDNKQYLLGFYGESANGKANELYLLNGQTIPLEENKIVGDSASGTKGIYSTSKDHLIVKKKGSTNAYHLSDLKFMMEEEYTYLLNDFNNNFIAGRDNKMGIIDENLKIIVLFEYDFISLYEDFYLLYKDGSVAIMDKNYERITEFAFTYSLNEDTNKFTTASSKILPYQAYKLGENYLLENRENKKKYLVSKEGEYKEMEEEIQYDKENKLLFKEDLNKKNYTFYNVEGKEKYSVDLSLYDVKKVEFRNHNNQYLVAKVGKNNLYYDYETGEELTELDEFVYEIKNIKLSYDNKEQIKISDSTKSKKMKLKNSFFESFFIHEDKTFTIMDEQELIVISQKK